MHKLPLVGVGITVSVENSVNIGLEIGVDIGVRISVVDATKLLVYIVFTR